MLGEAGHAGEQLLGGGGDFAGVFRLGVLPPTQAHGAQQGDERGGRGEHDVALRRPHDQLAIRLERGAEQRLGGEEQHHLIQGFGKRAGIVAGGEGADGVPQLGRVGGEGGGAGSRFRGVQGVEEVQVRNFGVHEDEPVAGEMDHEIGFAVAGDGLLAEIAMGAEAGGFHHAAQRFLAPAAAGLVGPEHAPQLGGLAGQRLALEREGRQVLPHFAQGGGLARLALLQPLLVGLQLRLQRGQEGGDGLLALGEVALGDFLEAAQRFAGELEEFGLGAAQGLGAERLEGLPHLEQRPLLRTALFGQLLLPGRVARLGAGAGDFGGGQFLPFPGQLLRVPAHLLPQLRLQPAVRRSGRGTLSLPEQPAQQTAQTEAASGAGEEAKERRHGRRRRRGVRSRPAGAGRAEAGLRNARSLRFPRSPRGAARRPGWWSGRGTPR